MTFRDEFRELLARDHQRHIHHELVRLYLDLYQHQLWLTNGAAAFTGQGKHEETNDEPGRPCETDVANDLRTGSRSRSTAQGRRLCKRPVK